MKKILFTTIILSLFTTICFSQTQFKATTYDKVFALAKRYNKPLLLDVATSNKPNGNIYKLFQDKELAAYISKNFITARVSMDNEANKGFNDMLNYLIYPCVVFYTPQGEQLESSNWYFLVNGKEDLRSLAQISLDNAAFKAKNSRKVEFDSISFDTAVAKAKKENKLVFVSNYYPKFHSYSMIVNDIFSQDSVADLYNKNFVNIQIDNYQDNSLVSKYIGEDSFYPNYMFFDSDGAIISMSHYNSTEEYIANGKEAIKSYNDNMKPHFQSAETLEEAIKIGKPLFINLTDKVAEDTTLNTPYVARYINTHFTPLFIDASNNTTLKDEVKKRYNITENNGYIFTDSIGNITHKLIGNYSAQKFYANAELAANNKGLLHYESLYSKGRRDFKFIRNYVHTLHIAGEEARREKVVNNFTNKIKQDDLLQKEVFRFIVNEVSDLNNQAAKIFTDNYQLFETKFGITAYYYRKNLWLEAFKEVTGDNYSRSKYRALCRKLKDSNLPKEDIKDIMSKQDVKAPSFMEI